MSWGYLWHRDRKRAIKAVYDNCPERCQNDNGKWDFDRKEFCETCPQRYEQEKFRDETGDIFTDRFGSALDDREFNKLLTLVYQVANLEESEIPYSVKTGVLLQTFLNEKYKFDRAKAK